jgi:hypothetical protein
MTNDLHTLLRDSLQAEADDVVAGPELFDRIRADADRRPPLSRRVAPWLLVAAAAAGVAGLLVTIQDDEQSVSTPSATQPSVPTTPVEPTTPTSAFVGSGIPTERPDQVVAVLTDGRLVVLDVESGAITRELASFGEATPADAQLQPQDREPAIIDAAVSPDRRTVYFGTAGAEGGVYRMPVDGSTEPERIGDGWGVSVSSDGRWLAYALPQHWGLIDLDSGADHRHDSPASNPQVSISPDGRAVEVISFDPEATDVQGQVVVSVDDDGEVTGSREGFADWQHTHYSDGSGGWLIERIESDDGSTMISWGTSEGGLTTGIPNPEGLVVRTVDW